MPSASDRGWSKHIIDYIHILNLRNYWRCLTRSPRFNSYYIIFFLPHSHVRYNALGSCTLWLRQFSLVVSLHKWMYAHPTPDKNGDRAHALCVFLWTVTSQWTTNWLISNWIVQMFMRPRRLVSHICYDVNCVTQ